MNTYMEKKKTEDFFKKNFIKPIKIQSDKNFINDIKKINNDLITFNCLINHISANPSLTRYNILNNLFHFDNFNDEEKTKILVVCFFSGKGKIFKKSLSLLSEKTLPIFNEQIINFIQYTYNNQNISNNIKILGEYNSEFFNYLRKNLINVVKNTNLNSIFASNIIEHTTDKEREQLIFIIKKKYESFYNLKEKSNIDLNSTDFINFYNKYLLGNNSLLIKIIVVSKTNITPFLKGVHQYKTQTNNNYVESLYNENLGEYATIFFDEMVLKFIHHYDSPEKRNSFDKYFQTISFANDILFLKIINKIADLMQSPNFYMENSIYSFKKTFINFLNFKNQTKLFDIDSSIKKTYPEIIKEYQIQKEKIEIISKVNNIQKNSKIIKRI